MDETAYENLTQLGGTGRDPGLARGGRRWRRWPTRAPAPRYLVRFTCPEFTALCPVTGQPDFAHIVLDYVPGERLVESKSLKVYLASFRNHGAFHEECTLAIAEKVQRPPGRCGCASAATGIRAAAFPSTCSIRAASRPRGFGFPIRACRRTGVGVDRSARHQGSHPRPSP